jgi:UPF0755 protein
MGSVLSGLFAAVILLGVAAAAVLGWGWSEFNAPGPLTEDRTVIVPRGSNVIDTAMLLQNRGVVRQPWVLAAVALSRGDEKRIKAGEYRFTAGISGAGILALLVSGQVVQHRLTIPEGLTVRQIARLVAEADFLTGEVPLAPPEGSLLPETYFFQRGDTRAQAFDRMRRAMTLVLEDAWSKRDDGLPLKTPADAIILASIVERETAVPAERPQVAGVFYNRLARGMKLQSDPTVIYGVSNGLGVLDRDLTRADLDGDSRWNTYRIAGLPPTPIANVGRASLDAVLHPAKTKALYFVADGDGGHAFAETLDQHSRNVTRWRQRQAQPAAQ